MSNDATNQRSTASQSNRDQHPTEGVGTEGVGYPFEAAISNQEFSDWYAEQQIEENILNGQLYFNGLTPPPVPEKHTPSKLLQCHRKVAYERENAPREGAVPEGLFWSGERFEEDVIVPFLQDVVTTEETYVQNSIWIDTTIEAGDYELRLKGATDPAIVTKDGSPLLVTEVKTKSSIENQSEPDRRHKAQLHAYLKGLSEKYDRSIEEGVLIYGSRTTFDIETFSVSFDPEFWDSVIDWMGQQTEYRDVEELPPADPETDWECKYCSFRHRCGQTDAPYEDEGYTGLLPGVEDYRKQQVREYLEFDEAAKLPPTLATKYPELADEFEVKEWYCPECGHTKTWSDVSEPPDADSEPICDQCAKRSSSLSLMQVSLDSDR